LSSVLDTKILIKANSFHVFVIFSIARVVATGTLIGTIMLKKILKKPAPSMRADSTTALGIALMYSVDRYIPIGNPAPI